MDCFTLAETSFRGAGAVFSHTPRSAVRCFVTSFYTQYCANKLGHPITLHANLQTLNMLKSETSFAFVRTTTPFLLYTSFQPSCTSHIDLNVAKSLSSTNLTSPIVCMFFTLTVSQLAPFYYNKQKIRKYRL